VGDDVDGFGISTDVTHGPVRTWMTQDKNNPLVRLVDQTLGAPGNLPAIVVQDDPSHRYQRVEGFGAALTDAAAGVLHYDLGVDQRHAVIADLMSPVNGIGLNMLRIGIGATGGSTWNGGYSYDEGGWDPTLANFSIDSGNHRDDDYIIPELHRILGVANPDVQIIASPWSPPAWMKFGSSSLIGGGLRGDSYGTYANYIVDFLRAYQNAGIPIYAITPQNEPNQPADYPSMDLGEPYEAALIHNRLAPAMRNAGFGGVKILGYDHNWVDPVVNGGESYPFALLDDASAGPDTYGIAYHCYGSGDPATMTTLHQQHPDTHIYVTECDRTEHPDGTALGLEGIQRMIRAMRNWSKTYIAWQLVLHPDGTPSNGTACMHPDGSHCVGVVSVDPVTKAVHHEWDYAYLGHASKFVQRQALRVDSSDIAGVENVAFLNPSGQLVLVAYNPGFTAVQFQVQWHGEAFATTLPARAVATYTW
jgi:glucosylceramidase